MRNRPSLRTMRRSLFVCTALALALGSGGCPDRPLKFPLPRASLDMAGASFDLAGSHDLAAISPDCTVCAQGVCGKEVQATMTTGSAPPGWSFNEAPMAASGASYDSKVKVAVLNQDLAHSAGSIFYRIPIATDIVDIRFDARVIHKSGDHADGMAFVLIENDPSVADIDTAVGAWGGSLGMTGATALNSTTPLHGFGVELDCYDNDNPQSRCGESIRGEHINIDTLEPCAVDPSSLPTPVATPVAVTLSDGMWRTILIHIENGQMSVTLDVGGKATELFSNVALPGFINGHAYYYGFTGATGELSERHEIRNISFAFPTARCL